MWETLNRIQQQGVLVDLYRERFAAAQLRGFVSAATSEFVLLALIDSTCTFDGAVLLRTEDITEARWGSANLTAWARALTESPSSPEPVAHIELESWECAIRSAHAKASVLTLYREDVDRGYPITGTNIEICGDTIEVDSITGTGAIGERCAVELAHLTRIDVGGRYESAYARLARTHRQAVSR